MPNKKGCYLVWSDGHLTCTVQHRDYSKCDLNRPPEASEGKPDKRCSYCGVQWGHMPDCKRPTPSALPTGQQPCPECGHLDYVPIPKCETCGGRGTIEPPQPRSNGGTAATQAQPQESAVQVTIDLSALDFTLEAIYGKHKSNKAVAGLIRRSLAAEHTRGAREELKRANSWSLSWDLCKPATGKWQRYHSDRLQQLTKEPK